MQLPPISQVPLFLFCLGVKMAWWTLPFTRTGPIHLQLVEAVSKQCPTKFKVTVGLKDESAYLRAESARPFCQVGYFFRNAVRNKRSCVYRYLRCCHFDMSASTPLSPPKKQSWLDERRWGSGSNKTKNLFLFQILY